MPPLYPYPWLQPSKGIQIDFEKPSIQVIDASLVLQLEGDKCYLLQGTLCDLWKFCNSTILGIAGFEQFMSNESCNIMEAAYGDYPDVDCKRLWIQGQRFYDSAIRQVRPIPKPKGFQYTEGEHGNAFPKQPTSPELLRCFL